MIYLSCVVMAVWFSVGWSAVCDCDISRSESSEDYDEVLCLSCYSYGMAKFENKDFYTILVALLSGSLNMG